MKIIYLVPFLLFVIHVYGQDSLTKKVSVHPSLSLGLAEGKSNSAVLLNAGIGVQYKTYQGGVGIGIDEYYFRTTPVYFETRKYLLTKKSTPFAFGMIGRNLPWIKTKESSATFSGGLFYDIGVGYQLSLKNKHAVFFSAGYSYKELSSEQSYPVYCITWPCPEQRQYFQYQLRKLSLKAGVNF